ncbi:alpha/beta fold hydrolase [Dankookia sp. GCM10030260]|uniref:alpha/beta fold hydrolase n=1 Tax=Dankookia sp. GCM10030260 TaxID=3273390 RepID=UPI0036146220
MAPRQRFVSARDGLRLAARDWAGPADATPLLCLSGISRSGLDFIHVAEHFAGTRRIVALDYAGHGESGRAAAPGRYAPQMAIGDVLDAMAALGLHRVALLGTSFGGILGMALGTVRPGVLAGLALNDTGPSLQQGGLDSIGEIIGRDPGFATRDEAVAFLKARLPPLGITEAGWPEVAERTYQHGRDGRWHPRWDIRIVDILPKNGAGAPDLWPFFRAIPEIPTLLVWGQESTVLAARTVQDMRAARPEMALCSLPGIGHAPGLGEPAALEAIGRWLAQMP